MENTKENIPFVLQHYVAGATPWWSWFLPFLTRNISHWKKARLVCFSTAFTKQDLKKPVTVLFKGESLVLVWISLVDILALFFCTCGICLNQKCLTKNEKHSRMCCEHSFCNTTNQKLFSIIRKVVRFVFADTLSTTLLQNVLTNSPCWVQQSNRKR